MDGQASVTFLQHVLNCVLNKFSLHWKNLKANEVLIKFYKIFGLATPLIPSGVNCCNY